MAVSAPAPSAIQAVNPHMWLNAGLAAPLPGPRPLHASRNSSVNPTPGLQQPFFHPNTNANAMNNVLPYQYANPGPMKTCSTLGFTNGRVHEPLYNKLKRKLDTMLSDEQMMMFRGGSGDYTVQCGDRSWPVYSAVVFPRCKFFATAAKWKHDGEEKVIHLSDDDPKAIDVLINFLYTRNSEVVALSAPFAENPVQFMTSIAITADKYDQPLLLEQVKIELAKLIDPTYVYSYDKESHRGKDLLRALAQLKRHDGGSANMQKLEVMILHLLRDSGALKKMHDEMVELLEAQVAEDVSLATLLVKYYAGGDCGERQIVSLD